MVSVCLPSDALLQHLPSYLGFSYLGRGVSLHGCSSKAQPLLLTLDEGYLLTAALPDLQCGIAPLGPPAPAALSNSMKLWTMPCRATQDRQVMVESSDKMWSTGEGNGKPFQHACLENPMNSMKYFRQSIKCNQLFLREMKLGFIFLSTLKQSISIWSDLTFCEHRVINKICS